MPFQLPPPPPPPPHALFQQISKCKHHSLVNRLFVGFKLGAIPQLYRRRGQNPAALRASRLVRRSVCRSVLHLEPETSGSSSDLSPASPSTWRRHRHITNQASSDRPDHVIPRQTRPRQIRPRQVRPCQTRPRNLLRIPNTPTKGERDTIVQKYINPGSSSLVHTRENGV